VNCNQELCIELSSAINFHREKRTPRNYYNILEKIEFPMHQCSGDRGCFYHHTCIKVSMAEDKAKLGTH
jgi:hypothetical protein